MSVQQTEFGKLALAGLPAAARPRAGESIFGAFAQAKPNSLVNGVQIGTITYSYREMPDQSAEATLKYILDSGISAVELMGGPVESFAGTPRARRARRRARRRRRRAADGGGRGSRRRRRRDSRRMERPAVQRDAAWRRAAGGTGGGWWRRRTAAAIRPT